MKKIVLNGKIGKDRVMTGINLIADSVSITLGSNGKNAMIIDFIEKDYQQHWYMHNTKDGVTVALNIKADEAFEQAGVMLMQEASGKTMEQAGDGTTTTVVLARELCRLGLEKVYNGANPVDLKRGIERASEKALKKLSGLAIPIKGDNDRVRQVATVSANNDAHIGSLIAEAFSKIGEEGIIDIEEGKSIETEIVTSDGYKFNEGFIHPLFMNGRNKCEFENPLILVYDNQIEFMKNISPVIDLAHRKGRPLVIICHNCTGEALRFILANVIKQDVKLKCCVVRAPQVRGVDKENAINDIAMCCNATVLGNTSSIPLSKTTIDLLGEAKKVVITKDSTSIVGATKREDYQDALDNLRMDHAKEDDAAEKEKIGKRIAALIGGVATILVGAYTESEMREKKDRVDDAIRATKAAIEEGYVVGGGITFKELIELSEPHENDIELGEKIFNEALLKPLYQICENSGADTKEVIAKLNGLIGQDGGDHYGYNGKTNTVEDLMKAGIIDPAKVIRCCIQNATSVSGLFLTSECFIGGAY